MDSFIICDLDSNHWFTTKHTKEKAEEPLLVERTGLQIKLGLIPAPRPMRERFWSAILSERTLQAFIFLGIFLLFTVVISFVIWGWKGFSAFVRVAIPTGFTILFFALGWWVQTKTKLYRSGIALSAIAALFIPIDC